MHASERALELVDTIAERVVSRPSLKLEHRSLRRWTFGRGHVPPGAPSPT